MTEKATQGLARFASGLTFGQLPEAIVDLAKQLTLGTFDAASLTEHLGQDYAVAGVQFKPWPTSAHVTPFIEAALDLRAKHGAREPDIESVELVGDPQIRDCCSHAPFLPAGAADSLFALIERMETLEDVSSLRTPLCAPV
jgi:hypothetical protein